MITLVPAACAWKYLRGECRVGAAAVGQCAPHHSTGGIGKGKSRKLHVKHMELCGGTTAWLPGCLTVWLPDCLAFWLPGCLTATVRAVTNPALARLLSPPLFCSALCCAPLFTARRRCCPALQSELLPGSPDPLQSGQRLGQTSQASRLAEQGDVASTHSQ